MITPIIMEEKIEEVENKLVQLRERGVGRVHFDLGDGLFSELLSITPADLELVELGKMKVDLHLLVDDPTEWIEECAMIKPTRMIAQIERMGSQAGFLERVEGYNVEGGIALKIETPIEEIEEEVLKSCRTILLLAIPAGTSGQRFETSIIAKIEKLREKYTGSILIDGGVTPEVYKQVLERGATEAGSNSSYWRGDYEK